MVFDYLIDMYIFVHKHVSTTLPVTREYLGNYISCLKPRKMKSVCFQNHSYVFLHDKVNENEYVKVLQQIHNDGNELKPLKTKPCIYLQVAYDKQCINIYDNVKKYFVEGNKITRELLEYIVYDEHNIDLSKYDNYKIHVFTNDSTFDIFDKSDKFVL